VLLDNGCEIEHVEVPVDVPVPGCDLYEIGEFNLGYDDVQLDIFNGDAYRSQLEQIVFDWGYAEAYDIVFNPGDELGVDYFTYDGDYIWGDGDGSPRDYDAPTDTNVDYPETWVSSLFDAGITYTLYADFDSGWGSFVSDLIPSDFGIELVFSNGCVLQKTAVPRPVPTPDCSQYTISDFEIIDSYNRVEASLANDDIISTKIERIVFDWDYAEALSDLMIGSNNLYVDWFIWDGYYIWSSNTDDIGDLASVTDTDSDTPSAWNGPDDFYAGDTVNFRVDFDFALGGEFNGALSSWGLIPDDFGVTFYFSNGCVLEMPAVPRPLVTPIPPSQ
jgi:hypothetical protein